VTKPAGMPDIAELLARAAAREEAPGD